MCYGMCGVAYVCEVCMCMFGVREVYVAWCGVCVCVWQVWCGIAFGYSVCTCAWQRGSAYVICCVRGMFVCSICTVWCGVCV